ncbi:MAG: RIP metalloprotease RseP [Burkholderiaceae bacterium]|nr:RIP metalloprotease RseP [Burkholderiaceae bacterium]
MSLLQTLIAFLVALTLLIFVHELGHYLVARWCGVKVLRFSIGFGKPLLSWRVGPDRTEWTLSAIPLGGYVKMLDEREQPTEEIPPEELPRAFTRKSLKARSAIVAAGPAANFLLAILLYAMLGWIGVDEPVAVVDRPPAGTAAQAAGLQGGDRILAVDGRAVRSWNDVRLQFLEPVIERRAASLDVEREGHRKTVSIRTDGLPPDEAEKQFLRTLGVELAPGRVFVGDTLADGSARAAGIENGDELLSIDGHPIRRARDVIERVRVAEGRMLQFEVKRGDATLRIPVTPGAAQDDRTGERIGRIGASLQDRIRFELVRYGALEGLSHGASKTWEMSIFSLKMLGKMLTGDLSIRNLSGPITIADLAGRSARVGWYAYLGFLALISISLGVLNMLPIPVLDGGHLVYYALEAVRGRPLSARFVDITQKAGLGVIMVMMALALFNDIIRQIGS